MSFFGRFFRKVCDSIVSRYDYIKFVNNESQTSHGLSKAFEAQLLWVLNNKPGEMI